MGGRTKTSIIATISPGHKDVEETLSTLEYAHRAKNIQNKPEINQKLTKKIILKEYTEEIDKLKRDLMAARDKNGIYLAEETYNEITLKMDSQNRELNEKMLLLKALKDELSSKEKIFNEVSLHLVEKTEKLNEVKENLKKTTGDLIQTKKILHNTKRRYREKKEVIESHVKTENTLKNQATKILEVADIATQDTEALHKTIDRRKEVDAKIQTACERFSERMYENLDVLDGNLQHLRNQQLNCSHNIFQELDKIHNLQRDLAQNSRTKINEINNLCDNFLTKSTSLEEIFTSSLKEFNNDYQIAFSLVLEKIRKKEEQFQQDIKENLYSIDLYNEQQKSALDSMRLSIKERFNLSNIELCKHTEKINAIVEEIKEKSLENVENLQTITNDLNEERSLMAEEKKLMEALQQKHLRRQELAEQISNNVSYLDRSEKTIINSASNTTVLNKKYADDQTIKQQDNCSMVEQVISEAELTIDQNVAKCSTINIQLNNKLDEILAQTQQIFTSHTKYLKDLNDKTDKNESERKVLRSENCQKIKEKMINISDFIENHNKCVSSNVNILRNTNSSLQESVQNSVHSFNKQMKNCNRDIELFKKSECKTYKATGTTPKKKEFTYPRILAETSPHTRIVRRFRQENNWSDLDTTVPIDEESDCDAEDGIMSIRDLSDTEIVLNSTPNY